MKSIYIFIVLFIVLANIYVQVSKSISIEFEHNVADSERGELYYSHWFGFSEKNKLEFSYEDKKVQLKIPAFFLTSIRFDPLLHSGKIELYNVMLNHKKVDLNKIRFSKLHGIDIEVVDNSLYMKSSSNDPHFIFFKNVFTPLDLKFNDYKNIFFNSFICISLLILLFLFFKKSNFFTIQKLRYENIISSTILITLILFIIDFSIRGFLLNLNLHSGYLYLMNFTITFILLYVFKLLIHVINVDFIKKIVAIFVSLFFSLIYIFQYNLFLLYKDFATTEVINTLITDYKYWINNSLNMINIWVVILFLIIFALFYIYFSNFINSNSKINKYSKLRYKVLLLLCMLPLSSYSYKQFEDNKILLLPVEEFISETVHYLNSGDEFKVSKRTVRQKEAIQKYNIDFNVLLLVNESLRSDHLNLYGYTKDTSPNISNFFKDSYVYRAISQTAVTSSSLETIFTGVHTSSNSSSSSTIWSYMKQLDLETFYFGSQTLSWGGGLDRFFLEKKYVDKIFSPITSNSAVGHDDSITVDAFAKYIMDLKKPFFGVFHFNSTHYPYLEHPKNDKFFPVSHELDLNEVSELQNAYDNAIFYMDMQFQRVIDSLIKEDKLNNTVIIYLSDHAEAFGTHGELFHTRVFWIEGIQTPLMIYIPKNIAKRLKQKQLDLLNENTKKYVANIDIFPTILDLINTSSEKKLDGQSLLKRIDNPYIFSTISAGDMKFVYIDRFTGMKFTFDNKKHKVYISNLYKDPKELKYKTEDLSKKLDRKTAKVFISKYLNTHND